ncbi:MAG: acetyl-CoA carboxylase biotin carboxyl carrier protein subunit [SAR116 cluster bacterium]|nr:acetyl-CoA carboxylase biotin carboxyl carrier protein subunit [SAR116 cluster bacterium]RPH07454.1 MAG: acetyl-CoA carboxylase biotin carboxyl carrier protein subunit [Alphaproteobacteria bacterium TMED54]
MKEHSNKDLELIRKLSQLMSEEKILNLKYEKSGLKLSIDKSNKNENFNFIESSDITTTKATNDQNSKTQTNLDSTHPGALKAPMVGTAYSSPEPGKPPFVGLGDVVKKNQPLVIIEAMKVMNTINAPKSGKVVFIGFEDGQPVEFEQLLIIIE